MFVAGVGTGGTLTGVGQALRERNAGIRIVAVEPERSPVLSGGRPGRTRIHGLGAGFAPGVLDRSVIDEVVAVSDEAAADAAREIARKEGILAGMSSGAALVASRKVSARQQGVIVTVFPDAAERYLGEGGMDEIAAHD